MTGSYYATHGPHKKNLLMFHNLMLPDLKAGETADHINRHTLDNTTENVRSASRREQCINRNKFKNNTTGVTGVSYCKRDNAYVAMWSSPTNPKHKKSFSVAKYGEQAFSMAVALRKEKECTTDDYRRALCIV